MGKWGPPLAAQRWPTVHVRAAWVAAFTPAPYVQLFAFSAIAAMPVAPGPLCVTQFATLALVVLPIPVCRVLLNPARVPFSGRASLLRAVIVSGAIAVSGYLSTLGDATPPDAAVTVLGAAAMLLTLVAVVEGVLTIGGKLVERIYLREDGKQTPYLEPTTSAATRSANSKKSGMWSGDVPPGCVLASGGSGDGDTRQDGVEMRRPLAADPRYADL